MLIKWLLCIASLILGLCFSLANYSIPAVPYIHLGTFADSTPTFKKGTLFFVGDVMLGRNVELLIEKYGTSYPFDAVEPALQNADLTVGNFEAAIPKDHQLTKAFTFQFSVRDDYMPLLAGSGFDVLSLANNHALDYGEIGYTNTIRICEQNGIECHGHPKELLQSSIFEKQIGDTKVGFLFLHTLYGKPLREAISNLLVKLKRETDVQIVYIHWGVEYEKMHNEQDAELAHYLIDNGVDAIIGSHPHVVQDIEIYNNKPIFYSLGNFIFDQYFSKDVQEGLGIEVTLNYDSISYKLLPFTSIEAHSKTRPMSKDERMRFFSGLSGPSIATLDVDGYEVIKVPRMD